MSEEFAAPALHADTTARRRALHVHRWVDKLEQAGRFESSRDPDFPLCADLDG